MNSLCILLFAALGTSFTIVQSGILFDETVQQMKIEDDRGSVVEYVRNYFVRTVQSRLQGAELESEIRPLYRSGRPRLSAFKWKDCGDVSKATFNVQYMQVTPDPIAIPGKINISFNATINKDVDTGLTANLLLLRKFSFGWEKIPCIGLIGSCTYNVCPLLAGLTCPAAFQKAGVPCKCPFKAGKYDLPLINFEVDAQVFLPGDYGATFNLFQNKVFAGCLQLNLTFTT